jgi:hypothetical protein
MQPSILGLKKSFGFGDRLGLATAGHVAAAKKYSFAPIFAQQSIREMERTGRTPSEVILAAKGALAEIGFDGIWGSDADHLKTKRDIEITSNAGFTFFTIDPSAGVNNNADSMSEPELEKELQRQVKAGIWDEFNALSYTGQKFDLGQETVEFAPRSLLGAVAKYGHAVAIVADLAAHIGKISGQQPFEIEVSVDETEAPTSALEHLFFALELKRRGVKNLVSLAPRFVGEMEKGVDYKGDLVAFESELQKHTAIAKLMGPYKISVHSGSDKFAIYPIVGRVCGELLHVKTAGTSYLEALRCALQSDEKLFLDIVRFSHERFDEDRATYHISATSKANADLAKRNLGGRELEMAYLDESIGRQILHVTFGSVLTDGRLKPRLLDNLAVHSTLHSQLLEKHFEKHLAALSLG